MTEHNFESMRRAMVDSQLRTNAVTDPAVVAAMGAVARETFMPARQAAAAYVDTLVPLGAGRALNPPMALGRLLTALGPGRDDRALLVGAATGYSAVVLARLVARVTAVEEDAALLSVARAAAGAEAIDFVEGPLVDGAPQGAPYDLILIDGAVESVPDSIVAQLVEGGRLATGLVENGVTRLAAGRKGGGVIGLAAFADAEMAVLPSFERPAAFRF